MNIPERPRGEAAPDQETVGETETETGTAGNEQDRDSFMIGASTTSGLGYLMFFLRGRAPELEASFELVSLFLTS